MNEHRTQIRANLKEIADTFGLDFHQTDIPLVDNVSYLHFSKSGLEMHPPSFMLVVYWDKCLFEYYWLKKQWELKDINSVCTLLCELIS